MGKANQTCGTCRWWVENDDGHGYMLKVMEDYRQCMRAMETCDDEAMKDKAFLSPMITSDGSGFWSCIETRKDHCCNEWDERDMFPKCIECEFLYPSPECDNIDCDGSVQEGEGGQKPTD